MVNTRKVAGRRNLRFASLDEALADAKTLAAAERDGKLQKLGNWTLGQSCNHLAVWVDYAFDGAPVTPPLLIRIAGRIFKRRVLRKGIPAGSSLPKVQGGTLGIDVVSTDDGIQRLAKAYDRLKAGTPTLPNVLFGPLTKEEWIKLQLRHAELHLSFLRTVNS